MYECFCVKELLDLTQFTFPELFTNVEYVWDALKLLPIFLKQPLNSSQQGRIVGVPFIAEDVVIGKGTVIEHGAVIYGPTIIGEDCHIRANVYIRGNVIVSNRCVLGNACEFKNSLLFNEVNVPHFSYVGDSILGYKAHLGAGVILSNQKLVKGNVVIKHDEYKIDTGLHKLGAIIGDRANISCNCVLNPGSIIGRNSILYPNILWRGVCPPNSIVKLRQQQEIVSLR